MLRLQGEDKGQREGEGSGEEASEVHMWVGCTLTSWRMQHWSWWFAKRRSKLPPLAPVALHAALLHAFALQSLHTPTRPAQACGLATAPRLLVSPELLRPAGCHKKEQEEGEVEERCCQEPHHCIAAVPDG